MTDAQHKMLITLALIVRSMAAPDDQRDIDRRLQEMANEAAIDNDMDAATRVYEARFQIASATT
jgi:hypothetical protein